MGRELGHIPNQKELVVDEELPGAKLPHTMELVTLLMKSKLKQHPGKTVFKAVKDPIMLLTKMGITVCRHKAHRQDALNL